MKLQTMTKYLYDTNTLFAYFYTNGKELLDPLVESDSGQMRILKDSYSELLNLSQRSFGVKVAWDLYQVLTIDFDNLGAFPTFEVKNEYVDEIKSLMFRSISNDPKSKNARKHDIGYIDAAMMVTASRNNHILVTRDKRIHKAVADGLIEVEILKPFDNNFVPIFMHEFFSSTDLDLAAVNEAKKFLKRLLDKGCDPNLISKSEKFFKLTFKDFDQ